MNSNDITEDMGQAWADQAEAGIDLNNATITPGPALALLNLVADWDAFNKAIEREHTTPERLIAKAINNYLQPA